MASITALPIVILTAFIFAQAINADGPCPFSKTDCNCTGDSSSNTTFVSAVCVPKSGYIPKFEGDNGTYTITGEMSITGNTYRITDVPKPFNAFKSIGSLNLVQYSGPEQQSATWESDAFIGPMINAFSVSNIAQVIPPPPPLVRIATNLHMLHYVNCRENVLLDDSKYKDFGQLRMFMIKDTPITHIGANAFVGLEQTLTTLSLINANLNSFSNTPVKSLKKLENVNLAGNQFTHFDLSVLTGLDNLKMLDLSGNSKLISLEVGGSDLSTVSSSLQSIDLKGTAIEIIDPNFENIVNQPSFKQLDISGTKTLVCNSNMTWMATHALCVPFRINVANATCNGNETLHVSAFLQQDTGNVCPTAAPPPASTSTTAVPPVSSSPATTVENGTVTAPPTAGASSLSINICTIMAAGVAMTLVSKFR